jgi:hypothetical protein
VVEPINEAGVPGKEVVVGARVSLSSRMVQSLRVFEHGGESKINSMASSRGISATVYNFTRNVLAGLEVSCDRGLSLH